MLARTKNQRKKHKKRQQTSRGLKLIPPKLSALFELVNKVPPNAEMLDPFIKWEEFKERAIADYKQGDYQIGKYTGDEPLQDYLDRAFQKTENQILRSEEMIERVKRAGPDALEVCLKSLPNELRSYVWQEGEEEYEMVHPETRFDEAVSRYTFIRDSRQNLRTIILQANPDKQDKLTLILPIVTRAVVTIDEHGEIEIAGDRFSRAVEGVEAKRIRECAICRRFFWAGRITQQCCSTACAHALRNRRYRANYKEYLIRRHRKEDQGSQQNSTSTGSRTSKSNHKKGKKA